ncbi:MAG: hypothetical protein AAGA78_11200 [Pseudomonadota bacterium]
MLKRLSARAQVAEASREAHQALHVHPVFERLLSTDVELEDCLRALISLQAVYAAAEARRAELGVWEDLNLARQCAALAVDVGAVDRERLASMAFVQTRLDALGLLYTLHGAQFGSPGIAAHLSKHLPSGPLAFYGLKPNAALWRVLVAELEASAENTADLERIAKASNAAFSVISDHASQRLN